MGEVDPVRTRRLATARHTNSTVSPLLACRSYLTESNTLNHRLSLCHYFYVNSNNDQNHTTTTPNNVGLLSTQNAVCDSIDSCNGNEHVYISVTNGHLLRRSCIKNVCAEKHQSDPYVCCSYELVSDDRHRFHSQVDVRKNAMPNIAEYCFEEPIDWAQLLRSNYVDDHSMSSAVSLSSVTSMPKIKVRICDEWGRRINSIESPGSDLFDEILADAGFAMDKDDTASMRPDAFDVIDENGTVTSHTLDHIAKCQRCGHRVLKMQFSTSFSCE